MANEIKRAKDAGQKTCITSRKPPLRHASISQNNPTPMPIWGLIAMKNNPICGGIINPNKGNHSIFELSKQWTTGGERRKAIWAGSVAPNRWAVNANEPKPNKNKIARPIFSGSNAKGISGMSPQGAIKKISTLYGDFPDIRARVAGRYVSLQSMPGGK